MCGDRVEIHGRACRVPIRRVAYSDSRSLTTRQPPVIPERLTTRPANGGNNGWILFHSEVAGQDIACRLWSGHSRRYASGKLRTSVKISEIEEL